ncbi:MAG: dienelactone hydrolase family protein [Gammaproteobacteria bacterium]|nr:dienelactone hydrolase family protein [Gammaproteobacteria bacterium]MCP5199065.1 dienelactone hydrolase family protein [Gammaproteobacteria bacterium]
MPTPPPGLALGPAASVIDAPQAAGLHDLELRDDANRAARFTLALPDTPAPPGGHPLVLVLHYGGQPTRYYGRPLLEHLFGPALAALSPILVAPESRGASWSEPANEAFAMALLETVAANYAVDPARLVVGGYSLGAMGAWHLIEHYPERFSAAIPVAGLPNARVTAPVPVYTLATPSDEIFEYAAIERLVETLREHGRDVELVRVEAQGHYDVTGFAPALGAAAAWLTRVWGEQPMPSNREQTT